MSMHSIHNYNNGDSPSSRISRRKLLTSSAALTLIGVIPCPAMGEINNSIKVSFEATLGDSLLAYLESLRDIEYRCLHNASVAWTLAAEHLMDMVDELVKMAHELRGMMHLAKM